MMDETTRIYDPASRIAVVMVDCTSAAGALSRGHLSGPTAATCLAQGLAAVSLLGAECSRADETVTLKLSCPGPIGGFLVEATDAGTLRGYTNRKVLDDFDGMGRFADSAVFGASGTFQVIRSVPGELLSSGTVAVAIDKTGAVAHGLDEYYANSMQRRVVNAVAGFAGDDGVPTFARGVQAECPPDGDVAAFAEVARLFASGMAQKSIEGASASVRTVLRKIGLPCAEIRGTTPLSFACRCSPDRAKDVLAALPPEERAELPSTLDVTCHMCGRTWTVATLSAGTGNA